jgi:hypothetical protein
MVPRGPLNSCSCLRTQPGYQSRPCRASPRAGTLAQVRHELLLFERASPGGPTCCVPFQPDLSRAAQIFQNTETITEVTKPVFNQFIQNQIIRSSEYKIRHMSIQLYKSPGTRSDHQTEIDTNYQNTSHQH